MKEEMKAENKFSEFLKFMHYYKTFLKIKL